MRAITRIALLMTAACLVQAPAVIAYAADAPAAGAADGANLVDDVVITARRRAEDLDKVPVSITAFSGEKLQEQGVTVANDLQFSVPGLTFTGVAGTRENPPISLRGQGQTFGGALPGVQSYVNEVPVPGSMSTLYDIESVQVLKGPQGTLFGRNTTGGAILYTAARPTDQLEGYLRAGAGNLGYKEVEAAISIPLGDKAALRLSGDMLRRDGYTRDLTTGADLDDQHRDDWRVQLALKPVEGVTSDFLLTGYRVRENGGSEILYSAPASMFLSQDYSGFGGPNYAGTYQVQSYLAQQRANGNRTTWSVAGHPDYFKRDNYLVSNITAIDVGGGVELKNIIAYQETKTASVANLAGTPTPILWQGGPSVLDPHDELGGTGQFSDELHLSGLAFDDRLNWITGVSYIHEEPVGTFYQTVEILGAPGGPARPSIKTNNVVTDDYGIFAQGTYKLDSMLQGLSLTAGARYSVNKQELTALTGIEGTTAGVPNGTFVCQVPGLPGNTPAGQCNTQLNAKFQSPSWNLSLDWQINDDTLVYVATRRGFKAGGFNAFAIDPSIFEYQPEKITDVEVGVKGDWRLSEDFRLRASAAAYHSIVKDVQRFSFFIVNVGGVPTGATATKNSGEAEINGLELQGTAIFGEHFELTANYAHTDASISPAPGVTAGSSFGGVPKDVYSLQGVWIVPLDASVGDVRLSATLYHQSLMPFLDNLDQEPQAFAPAYSLVNLRADWKQVLGSKADLAFFVNNADDKEYLVDGVIGLNHSFGYSVHAFGAPRTYGVELKYHFD